MTEQKIEFSRIVAQEVIIRAVRDWQLLDDGTNETYTVNYCELENFFKSGWCYDLLTLAKINLTGEELLKLVKKGGMKFEKFDERMC